ncbi:MAG: peptidyl-prolyl cis-trans isomerase [Candidatus Binatota bacterium]|jgi:peptidyl-prolyl cis-trans isomerase D|nr:peptidyl-prolyl cis-trans isomerase [Candidatus Binatota bacterium]
MLNVMRRHAQSATIKVVFWMIILVFILWGVGSFREGTPTYAARVNGEDISVQDVRRHTQRLERFYKQMYGDNLTPEVAKALDFKSRAVDQMIDRELLRQEAERHGLTVSEDEVRDEIGRIEGLVTDGRFQRDVYFRFVRAEGMTPAEFEEQQRQDLLVRKIQDLIQTSVRVDPETARSLWTFENDKVNLSFVRIRAEDLTAEVKVSDADVKSFFEVHREDFREPERTVIEYVAYPEEKFAAAIQVSDEEIRQEYDLHKEDRYTDAQQVRARHILLRLPPEADEKAREEVHKRAETALERVKKGEDFAAVAKELSEDPANKDQGGDLGFFARGQMEEAFETAAFSLEPGSTSDLVETRHGFHVIKVEEKKPERLKPIEEVHDLIADHLKKGRAEEASRDAAFEDARALSEGKSFEDVAKARGLPVERPAPFAANEALAELPESAEIVRSAFTSPPGEIGPVTRAGDRFVLYRVKEKQPSSIPELTAIRARVESALKLEKAAEKAREKAKPVQEAVTQGKSLEDAAKAVGLSVEETGPFTRGGDYVLKIGRVQDLKKHAFALTPEKPLAPSVYVADKDAVVAVLKQRIPAEPAEFDTKKQEIIGRYEQEQKRIAIESLLNSLKSKADIRLNPDALAGA